MGSRNSSHLTLTYLLVAVVCSLLLDAVCELCACVLGIIARSSSSSTCKSPEEKGDSFTGGFQMPGAITRLPSTSDFFSVLHALGQQQGKQNQAFS